MLQLFYSSAKLLHFAANLLCRSVGVVLVSTLQVMVIQVVQICSKQGEAGNAHNTTGCN